MSILYNALDLKERLEDLILLTVIGIWMNLLTFK